MKEKITFIFVFLTVLISDQWTKIYFAENYSLGETREVIPGFFNFTLVYNPGAAFGMFADWPDLPRRIALTFVSTIALCIVVWFMLKEFKNDKTARFGLFLVISGAVGNLIDRYRYDSVVDFLDVYIGSYHWPAFNIADSAISIGVCILFYRMVKQEKNAKVEVKSE